tara:strand:- start:470 stop:2389 length:1920 start_codon:yes stop_codon:yes gene_type:complete
MSAGRLAASAPAATTNTVLYSTSQLNTASTVLLATERGGSAATYRVGLKDYTQKLTLDASSYKFNRGNPVSSYKLGVAPGISRSDATPGLQISSADFAKTASILDVVVDTSIITNYVKVKTYTSIGIDSNAISGTFQGGETVTGGTSGVTATFRGIGTTMNIEIADIASGATTLKMSDGTASVGSSYFVLSDGVTGYTAEVILVGTPTFYSGTTGGANVTVTRAQFGTSAAAHRSGQMVSFYQDAGTTTTINEGAQFQVADTTLTVTDGTVIVSGQYLRVGNEIMLCTGVVGNDLSVTRGQWGTTDAAHADGATVTPMSQGSQAMVNWFDTAETVTGGSSSATVDTQFTATSSAIYTTGFVWGTVSGQEIVPTSFTMDVERTYRFDQSDSTNTSLPLRFSDTQEGTGATPVAGTEYTTGVTKSGTAGTDGVIDLIPTAQSPNPLYYYAEGAPSTAGTTVYSASLTVVQDPQYTEILLYDVTGTWVTGDTFLVGTSTITVGTVTGGKYGWVTDWTAPVLSVALGVGSAAFANADTFVDTPPEQGADRSTVTASSVTQPADLATEDYIYYDFALAANSTNKHSGIVVGPNSHIVVYASSADLSFQVNGFENEANDFLPDQYNQAAAGGGGAGGGGGAAGGG